MKASLITLLAAALLGAGIVQAQNEYAEIARLRGMNQTVRGIRSMADLYTVIEFFEARAGALHGFHFRDPMDWKSCRPDGTPNPGFFGANVAAPLLVDVFAALEPPAAPQRTPPPEVTQARVCWPLGTRADGLPPELCHRERSAWLLHDAAPPTFPDRLRDGAARETDARDAVSGLRVRASCAPGAMRTVEVARWPALLEPWLDAVTRAKALPPP